MNTKSGMIIILLLIIIIGEEFWVLNLHKSENSFSSPKSYINYPKEKEKGWNENVIETQKANVGIMQD